MKTLIQSLSLLLVACLFSACANLSTHAPRGSNHTLSAADYLYLAENAEPQQKQIYWLDAAEQFLANNQPEAAQKIMRGIDTALLSPDSGTKLQLLRAYYQIETGNSAAAFERLTGFVTDASLSNSNQILLHRILAKAYQQQSDLAASIDQLNQLQNLLPDSQARQQNLLAIWALLENLSPNTLREQLGKTDSSAVRGWFDLALIENSYYSPSSLLDAIKGWEKQYSGHPARSLIDSHSLILNQNPSQVALLLPMKGPLAGSSEAIRNGFFAAYYYAKQHQEFAPSITLYDTSADNVTAVYQKAVQNGAQFVIGPLTKTEVAAVAQSALSVPTLALNSVQDFHEQRISNLYQFDLSPTTEAAEVAERAWQQNYTKAVIFALPAEWSQNIARSFQQRWSSLGGRVLKTIVMQNTDQVDAQVRSLLHAQVIEHAAKGEPHYRLSQQKDFDVVFLATGNAPAQQIVPLLKFYYNGQLPIYATSLIYDGGSSALKNNDLNGVRFCSMPWLIQPSTTLTPSLMDIRNRTQSLWAGSFNRYPKLYALGVDAFNLIPQLNKLVILPDLGLAGATGRLYLDNNHYINRQPVWTEIQYGRAVPQL